MPSGGRGSTTSRGSRRGPATTALHGPGTRQEASSVVSSYLHVYVELDEGLRDLFPVTSDGLRPVKVFAHYLGDDERTVRERFARVHEDVLYERRLR